MLLMSFSSLITATRSAPTEEIRVDLPSNGQLRVENQFGDVNISIGNERDVSVAAKFEIRESGNAGSAPGANQQNQNGPIFNRSPVVVNTKNNLLS
ncbi:MAG: hypothetical protein M3R68_00650, partial [Acidobacteriota bacterium]|nr:hypothetical protein [Acidobacteriota bacterium]